MIQNNKKFIDVLKIAVLTSSFKIAPYAFYTLNETRYLHDTLLISTFCERLASKCKVITTPNGQFGSRSPDGNWTGMMGMLQRKEADIAIGKLFFAYDRTEVAELYPYQFSPITFITDNPKYVTDKYGILHPFQPFLWVAIVVTLLLVQFLSYFFRNKKCSFQTVLLQFYGSLLEKSIDFEVRKVSAKLLVLSWVLGAMFITQSYKAVLLSFLTFPSLTGIRNIAELSVASEKSYFKCAAYGGSYVFLKALESGDESWQKIGKCVTRTNLQTTDFESFLRPSYQKAFIGTRPLLRSLHRGYFISDDSFFTAMVCVAVRKTFCCKDTVDKFLHRLAAVGILNKLDRDDEFFFAYGKHNVGHQESNRNESLTLEDFAVAFFFLILGLLLASFVLLIEIIHGKVNNN